MTKDDLSPTQGISRTAAPPISQPNPPEEKVEAQPQPKAEKAALPELNMFQGKGIYLHAVA